MPDRTLVVAERFLKEKTGDHTQKGGCRQEHHRRAIVLARVNSPHRNPAGAPIQNPTKERLGQPARKQTSILERVPKWNQSVEGAVALEPTRPEGGTGI